APERRTDRAWCDGRVRAAHVLHGIPTEEAPRNAARRVRTHGPSALNSATDERPDGERRALPDGVHRDIGAIRAVVIPRIRTECEDRRAVHEVRPDPSVVALCKAA